MDRPAVDVVMPFAGSHEGLVAARTRLGRLELRAEDTAYLADNRAGGEAGERPGSYFARNRGAERSANPWIVFVDADVEPSASLLDDYFAEPVADDVAVLVGSVRDEPLTGSATARPARRFAAEVGLMSQARTFERERWAFAQTANCAIRRSAFEQAGGFDESVRSGGDADLCFRLQAAGWRLEAREQAVVVHLSRGSLAALLRQRARVGAGARWLSARYPGFAASRPLARVLGGAVRELGRAAVLGLRGEPRAAQMRAVGALAEAAFHLGWRLPNRPGRRS